MNIYIQETRWSFHGVIMALSDKTSEVIVDMPSLLSPSNGHVSYLHYKRITQSYKGHHTFFSLC